jgi:diguanylate cyclase (GGDEF)-like protein/PAS domain S-box-containing protein
MSSDDNNNRPQSSAHPDSDLATATLDELRDSERELRAILENMLDTYFQTDKDGNITRVSPAVEQLLGYQPKDVVGLNVGEIYIDHNSRKRFLDALTANGGTLIDYEIQLTQHNREPVWVSINARYRRDENNNITGVEGMLRDINARKATDSRMRKLSRALEQTADSVLMTDAEGVVEYVNPAFEETTGYSRDEVIGRRRWLLRSDKLDAEYYDWAVKTINAGHIFRDVIVSRRKDGSLYYEEKSVTPVKDDFGNITNFISTGKDITKRMQTQERLQHPAHHDMLTELPNRALFADRLDHALTRKRAENGAVAVLVVDLDQFKKVNETLSHDVGDQILQAMSERISRCVRDSDTVARVGGDEFAIILEEIRSTDHVAPIARKILNALAMPFDIGDRELYITTSIGVSLFPLDGDNSHRLLKCADIAMYRAKEHGRNTYKFYSSDLSVKAFQRLNLETALQQALDRDEFVLFFQPHVDTAQGKIVGMEALLRWKHPDLGLVSPVEFLPILEETKLILPVGEWVLQQACHHAKSWFDAGHTDVRVSVNLTRRQFVSPSLKQSLQNALRDSGLEPQLLELEVSETLLTDQSKDTAEIFRAIDALGINVAIDNFGTDLSSLRNLRHYLIDTVKIDRTFIGDITYDPDDAAIVRSIIAMARPLNLRVIAKGVESVEQLKFLVDHHCQTLQGFIFGPPRPGYEINEILKQDNKSF